MISSQSPGTSIPSGIEGKFKMSAGSHDAIIQFQGSPDLDEAVDQSESPRYDRSISRVSYSSFENPGFIHTPEVSNFSFNSEYQIISFVVPRKISSTEN